MFRITPFLFLIIFTLGGAFYLRYPSINYGMPYFYDEDEAHHFNRSINMAKSGDLNPHYFHKPSLHFYLRMPVIYAAYLWSKKQGYIESLSEVRTFNRYGIADYAFTASHPSFVKWNRAWSVLISLLLVLFTILISKVLTHSNAVAFASGVLCATSPALIEYSGVIGVDILMSLMCLISVYFALLATHKFSFSWILLSSLFAGLAVSSKYNAAPIGAVPIAALLVTRQFNFKKLFIVICLSAFSFFLASPYILISFNEFLSDLKYEIWHYSVAGHVGHMANPGLEQVYFYTHWLTNQGVGLLTFVTACLGMLALYLKNKQRAIVFLIFPFLFFILMVSQKANFVRNMLVVIPFLCILSAYAGLSAMKILDKNRALYLLGVAFLSISTLLQPFSYIREWRESILSTKDSRDELINWLEKQDLSRYQIAISGYLQLPPSLNRLKNITTINQEIVSPLKAYFLGYDKLIYYGDFRTSNLSYLWVERYFSGVLDKERIVNNPALSFITISNDITNILLTEELSNCKECKLGFSKNSDQIFRCDNLLNTPPSGEDYCWATTRYFKVQLNDLNNLLANNTYKTVSLEVMSPWPDQELKLHSSNGIILDQKRINQAGEWIRVNFEIPSDRSMNDNSLIFSTSKVRSPFKESASNDTRRLSLAIRNISIN